tara:strand:+ start:527 stop:817 length:291 start_codon:yes stop_codon:yes gene_type:complete
MGNNVSNTSILTADGQATSYPAKVYWLLVSAAATGGAWQINDSTDDSGTDLLSGVQAANTSQFIRLGAESEGALMFNAAVYVDIPGSNITITVGHS